MKTRSMFSEINNFLSKLLFAEFSAIVASGMGSIVALLNNNCIRNSIFKWTHTCQLVAIC